MKAKTLCIAVFTTVFMLLFSVESHAQGCGFASINNAAACGTVVTVVTTFGNTFTSFIPSGGTVTFPFLAFTECVASISFNCSTVNQPQFAICVNIVTPCAICPRRLCITGTNSWQIQ